MTMKTVIKILTTILIGIIDYLNDIMGLGQRDKNNYVQRQASSNCKVIIFLFTYPLYIFQVKCLGWCGVEWDMGPNGTLCDFFFERFH